MALLKKTFAVSLILTLCLLLAGAGFGSAHIMPTRDSYVSEVLVTQMYAVCDIEPGEYSKDLLKSAAGSEKGPNFTPAVMIVGLVLLFGRAVQITRKSRSLLQRGPIRKRRSFSVPVRDDEPVSRRAASCSKTKHELDGGPEVTIYRVAKDTYLEDTEEEEK